MNQTIRNSKREPSSLVSHKDDEKLLSESLYRNLHVIQRFHNPTSDFLLIYEQHMFIKPNQKAFFHVLHLIFVCLDAAEFNKRFLWPIYDKAAESRFRNSTLDYINHLNTIHQLGFETLKLHNIHIPGGLKFIKIVHKLSVLAMKITLNRNTKSIPNVNDIPDANEQLAKLEEVVDDGLDFVARLEAQSNLVSERTDELKRTMASFFHDSTINNVTKEQCWRCLLDQWRNQLDHVVENDVKPKLELVAVISKNCADLESNLTKLFVNRKENVIEYDNGKLVIAQNILMKWNPDLKNAIAEIIQNNCINFDHLLQFRDLEVIEYESDQITILDARISQVQKQFIDFENEIKPFLEKQEKRFREFCLNVPNLPFRIMQTPIVTRKIGTTHRFFELMDDNPTSKTLFNETLPSKLHTINKHQNLNVTIAAGSAECSYSSMQSSKARSDAMQILSRNKTSRGNTTHSLRNLSVLNGVLSPKFSSTICSTVVKNHENKFLDVKISPVFSNASFASPNSAVQRTFPANSGHHFNYTDIRGSPTGRWEVNDNIPGVHPNLFAPTSVNENASFLSSNSAVQRKFSANSGHRLNYTDIRGSPTGRWEVNDNIAAVHPNLFTPTSVNGNHHREDEVQADSVDSLISTLTQIRIDEEEFLGNISDTVLNNILN